MSEAYRVPALVAAIRVLEELANAGEGGVSQADLVRETGISKSTMHNLLGTLEAEGFVRRSADRGFQLGGALVALGAAAARGVRPLALAIRELPQIALRHGLSVAVGQLTPDGYAQIIERAYPPTPLHVGIRVGSRYGPFDGAIGKCLLALQPSDAVERLVARRSIPAHTDRTLTDPAALLEEIERVRRRGWGSSIGEYNSNVALAAPIAGSDGTPEGVLLALGFPNDVDPDSVPEVGAALRSIADSITAQAGGDRAAQRSAGIDSSAAAHIQKEELV